MPIVPVVSTAVYVAIAFGAAVALVATSMIAVAISSKRRRVVTRADIDAVAPRLPSDYFAHQLNDPNFEADAFLEVAQALFDAFHKGIETGKLEAVRPFFAHDLFTKHIEAVQARALRAQRAVMKNFKTHRMAIRNVVTIRSWDSVTVRVLASCADYEVDAEGKVYGDKQVRAWEEDWSFERSTDTKSKLKETWIVTNITPVDRNRFRPGERAAAAQRNADFRAGRTTRTTV